MTDEQKLSPEEEHYNETVEIINKVLEERGYAIETFLPKPIAKLVKKTVPQEDNQTKE